MSAGDMGCTMSEQIDERERSERRADALADELRLLRHALRTRELLLEKRERQLADKTEVVQTWSPRARGG